MNLLDVLRIQYPTADFVFKVIVQDDGDSKGLYIFQWDNTLGTQPTQDQINGWLSDPTTQQKYTFAQNAIANVLILNQLNDIDNQSIRALREPSTASTARLQTLTTQAVALRAQLLPTQ
jgi:hypothetical protein